MLTEYVCRITVFRLIRPKSRAVGLSDLAMARGAENAGRRWRLYRECQCRLSIGASLSDKGSASRSSPRRRSSPSMTKTATPDPCNRQELGAQRYPRSSFWPPANAASTAGPDDQHRCARQRESGRQYRSSCGAGVQGIDARCSPRRQAARRAGTSVRASLKAISATLPNTVYDAWIDPEAIAGARPSKRGSYAWLRLRSCARQRDQEEA